MWICLCSFYGICGVILTKRLNLCKYKYRRLIGLAHFLNFIDIIEDLKGSYTFLFPISLYISFTEPVEGHPCGTESGVFWVTNLALSSFNCHYIPWFMSILISRQIGRYILRLTSIILLILLYSTLYSILNVVIHFFSLNANNNKCWKTIKRISLLIFECKIKTTYFI